MGDQADNVDNFFKIPTTPEGWATGLVGGPAGMIYRNMKEGEEKAAQKKSEEEQAAADAKAKAEADAKATADAKAAEAAATEEARRLAELRLARRSRAMTTDSDTTDSARLRLG